MRQTNVRGTLSLRGFRKLRTGAIVATGVILLGLGFLAPTVSANEQDGVWLARTVAEVKADIQNIDNLSYYTIKWGDTLSAISGATGLSVDSLVEINRIANRDLIFANNKLYFSEEAFLKDGNTEVKRQRVSIDNSGSCQSYEVETKTNTVTGEQRTTVKQTTPVVVETPAVSAAKAEESVSPAPKVEEPVTPAPKVEESVTPAPKVEEPASSAPKVEEPVTPAPKVEEPASTTPKAEESASPAPKADEPSATTPKVEEPATPAPKVEEPTTPAPKADEPASTTPKAEEPAAPALKDDESGSSVESPSTGNHSDESGAPSTTPTGDSTATQPSDSTSSPVTPSEEAPVTSGDANSTTQPAGESGSSETTSEPSNTPSAEATNDSGNAATSTPTPEASTSEPKSEEELKKEEALKSAKKESIDDNIGEVVKIKADAIEKVTDADEKARLKEALKALQDKAIEEINKAKDDEEVATVTEKYQNEINALDVPGEEVSSPNYGKEGLTNNGPGGTTIDNGSTAIGHGASGTSRSAVASPSESSTQPSSTSEGASSFRNAPSVQARARRVARSTSEPDGTVNISYNFAGMPDIHGFLSDPGENNTVTIPAGTSEAQAKELVKEKIQAKIKDLAARGYHVKNDIIFEQDTTVKNYNYVVTFTKETTGTSGFRMAPAVQPRASRNRRSLEQPAPQKVKVNVFYNFDQMKDIAGFLGDINGTSLEIAEGLSNEQVKAAVESQVDTKKEELSKRGYTFKEDYVYQSNGKDYNYVVTFSKAAK